MPKFERILRELLGPGKLTELQEQLVTGKFAPLPDRGKCGKNGAGKDAKNRHSKRNDSQR